MSDILSGGMVDPSTSGPTPPNTDDRDRDILLEQKEKQNQDAIGGTQFPPRSQSPPPIPEAPEVAPPLPVIPSFDFNISGSALEEFREISRQTTMDILKNVNINGQGPSFEGSAISFNIPQQPPASEAFVFQGIMVPQPLPQAQPIQPIPLPQIKQPEPIQEIQSLVVTPPPKQQPPQEIKPPQEVEAVETVAIVSAPTKSTVQIPEVKITEVAETSPPTSQQPIAPPSIAPQQIAKQEEARIDQPSPPKITPPTPVEAPPTEQKAPETSLPQEATISQPPKTIETIESAVEPDSFSTPIQEVVQPKEAEQIQAQKPEQIEEVPFTIPAQQGPMETVGQVTEETTQSKVSIEEVPVVVPTISVNPAEFVETKTEPQKPDNIPTEIKLSFISEKIESILEKIPENEPITIETIRIAAGEAGFQTTQRAFDNYIDPQKIKDAIEEKEEKEKTAEEFVQSLNLPSNADLDEVKDYVAGNTPFPPLVSFQVCVGDGLRTFLIPAFGPY